MAAKQLKHFTLDIFHDDDEGGDDDNDNDNDDDDDDAPLGVVARWLGGC